MLDNDRRRLELAFSLLLSPGVLAMRYELEERALVILHNFGSKPRVLRFSEAAVGARRLVDLLETHDSDAGEAGQHTIELEPHAYRWFRAGGLYQGAAT